MSCTAKFLDTNCRVSILRNGTDLGKLVQAGLGDHVDLSRLEVPFESVAYLRSQSLKVGYYLFTVFLGVILAVHLAMNGRVGGALDNARVGNALFWAIGAVAAILIGLTGWRTGALDGLKTVNPLLLTAGALGACLVFAIAWMIPNVGARFVFIGLIAGQVLGGMVLSHFGWLGSPVQPITLTNVLGAVIMLVGVVVATYTR
jgi:bacterial/archaeal transporter family-2 protein